MILDHLNKITLDVRACLSINQWCCKWMIQKTILSDNILKTSATSIELHSMSYTCMMS